MIVPTQAQFELYRWCLREKDEATALDVIGLTESCLVRPLDTRVALSSADLATRHKLAMADAIVILQETNIESSCGSITPIGLFISGLWERTGNTMKLMHKRFEVLHGNSSD